MLLHPVADFNPDQAVKLTARLITAFSHRDVTYRVAATLCITFAIMKSFPWNLRVMEMPWKAGRKHDIKGVVTVPFIGSSKNVRLCSSLIS